MSSLDRSGSDATAERDVAATRAARRAPPDAVATLGAATLALGAAAAAAAATGLLAPPALTLAALLWAGVLVAVVVGLGDHRHARFGAANAVTTLRAVVTVGIGALALELGGGAEATPAAVEPLLWWITAAAIAALALDGIDGPLARRSGLESAFGARYDMEVDALLALVLAVLIWRTGELGAWILVLGTMRYVFVAAARFLPALNAPLYPSLRRKAVCVVQIAALCAIVSPLVAPPLATAIGLPASVALVGSFARDTLWLLRGAGRRS